MTVTLKEAHNVITVVPALMVTNMEQIPRLLHQWPRIHHTEPLDAGRPSALVPDVVRRRCAHASGSRRTDPPENGRPGTLGNGSALYFRCTGALAICHEATARGIQAVREPQVGNFAWEIFFADPDGYKINFSSPTDLPEETLLSEVAI